jgi:tungstate transport system substrate-binding protein
MKLQFIEKTNFVRRNISLGYFFNIAATTLLCFLLNTSPVIAQEKNIMVSSSTSLEHSGLSGYILPIFEKNTGIHVHVVAVGTSQALDIARNGGADVVFVHDRFAEEKFLDEGYSNKRNEVMYNDFVLIGPKADPAKIAGEKNVLESLRKIAATQTPLYFTW